MIHHLSPQPPRTLERSNAPKAPQPPPQDTPPPQDGVGPGVWARVGGSLAGAGAGAAGLVYGGAKGLCQGVLECPGVVAQGGKLGTRVAEPVTRTLGAAVAVGMTGVAGVAVASTLVLAPVVALAAGTVEGTSAQGLALVRGGARTAADAGVKIGSTVLGAVGGTLGALVGLCTLPTLLYPPFGMKVVPQAVRAAAGAGCKAGRMAGHGLGVAVGGALGGLGGAVATVAAGIPPGLKQAKLATQQSVSLAKSLPGTAQELWAAGQSGGTLVAQATGGTVGVLAGAGTGLVNAGVEGLAEGIHTAARWGQSGYLAVAGPKEGKI